jgi:hypothetical protein
MLVELAVEPNGVSEVSGRRLLAARHLSRDLVRDPERGEHLGINALLPGFMPTLGEQAADEVVELRQRLRGRVDDERLEHLPLGLPLVAVEPWLLHREVPTARPGGLKHPSVRLHSPA